MKDPSYHGIHDLINSPLLAFKVPFREESLLVYAEPVKFDSPMIRTKRLKILVFLSDGPSAIKHEFHGYPRFMGTHTMKGLTVPVDHMDQGPSEQS
ncbi:hypothetical protein HA72_1000 [Metallosphaera sedula]|uniref:Uncharacterized protein n=3 Tax=Metallosphaera TaxID=41980 RepID=A4YFG6_METS5|nr:MULTISPECIES: hypothetical protein [Metallosphaera]ABP95168.1 hypothetical protein Msed_1000 [Metallosphaera sedula DSM 5348]AIM27154.1 hypothetical protein HA72_1000 [Metallosphaera sedula]AKV74056.1 hypothetical protein MsedA_1013 [Metallosphaera sedula]AKV76296.1 hypothetical protein MsedB_1015 [Metallosphaera sedula]AKV78547.1 hypothetical protein MsedC_1013 [Metallosphaera sedula]